MATLLKTLVKKLDELWAVPAIALARRSSARPAIERDVQRWCQVLALPADWSAHRSMAHLLGNYAEFRNLLQYRTRHDNPLVRSAAFRLRRPVETLRLDIGELGPGLFIQHGFATIISAERMGADCWVNQQVTVGHVYHRGRPSFGDRVTIAAGAVVVGPVDVGDDVTIGANTTVVKDIASGSVVVGTPNRVINRIDLRGSAGGEHDPRATCGSPSLVVADPIC